MYGYKKQLLLSFPEALEKTKSELAKEGFGVITEIDVRATLKNKLNVEYDNYIILGACNPTFAYQALQTEKDIGLLLPCNIILYEDNATVFVSAILPTVTMAPVKNSSLVMIAQQVEAKLKKIVDLV